MDSTMRWSMGHSSASHNINGCPTIKNHSVTYFSNHLYCFGGYDGRRNHSTLLIYSLEEERWIRPYHLLETHPQQHHQLSNLPSSQGSEQRSQQPNAAPAAGENHNDNNVPQYHNHHHHHHLHHPPYLSGAADHRYEVRGIPPPGRNGHSATLATDSSNNRARIVIIGGWLGTGPLAASDVHVLEISNQGYQLTWLEQPAEPLGTPPGPCNMHSADYVSSRHSVYVFRGGNGREYLNDLHALDVDTMIWTEVEVTGEVPQQRANHSSAILEETQELFVFGGWNGTSRLNDVHVLDTRTHTWSCPHVHGVLPHPRAGMTLTAIRNRLYLFGGSGTSAKCFDDLQILDRDTMSWLDVTSSSNNSSSANGANSTNNVNSTIGSETAVTSHMYEDAAQPDQHHWSPSDDAAARSASAGGNQANPNDQDTVPSVWLQGSGPGRRAGHTATAVHRQVFVFGGSCGSDYLNDFFTLDTDPPPSLTVSAAPTLHLVTQRLQHFLLDPEFSDVTFIVEGHRVYGHKMVLSIVSDCFRAMFSGGFREAEQNEIVIRDASYRGFCAVLEYIYTGALPRRFLHAASSTAASMPASPNQSYDDASDANSNSASSAVAQVPQAAVELLELADRFFLDHLKQTCECQLQHAVNADTVQELLSVAFKTNSLRLASVCRHFIRNHEDESQALPSQYPQPFEDDER